MRILNSFFRYFTHSKVQTGSLDYTRNIMRLSGVLAAGSTCLLYLFVTYYFNYAMGVYVSFFLVCYHIMFLYSIKSRLISDINLAHLSGIFSSIAINTIIYTTAPQSNLVSFWMLGGIVYAFWMAGIRIGLFWSIVYFVQILAMIYFKNFHALYVDMLPNHFIPIFNLSIYFGVFSYIILMLIYFDMWRKAVIRELNSLNFTKDRMITMVGHDLKNPLGILMGQAKILDQTKTFDQNYHESSKYLLNRMKRIIENMVVFERIGKDKLESHYEKIDLDRLMQDLLLEYAYHSDTHEITIEYSKENEITFENIDRVNLERVISNLISNSLKYSPRKSKVFITTSKDENNAIIKIKDEGIGIEKEQLNKLFEIYQKGPEKPLIPREESHGIGLYIVKELCKKIGAKIDVFSEGKDRGCEFKITIPLS